MNIKDKFIVRSSILELAETGTPRNISIDDKIRTNNNEKGMIKVVNLWDCITALGAQLSRPPYDPYREIINLEISIGRIGCINKVILSMPLIIYDNDLQIEDKSLESLHTALNWLAIYDKTNLGLVSEKGIKNRRYPYFKRINGDPIIKDCDSEGIVLPYKNSESIRILTSVRKEFCGPILVEIDDVFEEYIGHLLDAGADGIIVDTIKIANKERYRDRHAIKIIHDVRYAINQYYAGKENDGTVLVVAGDLNNTGKIVKAAALGADIIGYSTSLLIANAASHYENSYQINTISERICRHILATKGELKGVPAALGYSNFYNMSHADLRTSSIEASLQGDIAIEGMDKTYRQIMEGLIDEYAVEEGVVINKNEKQRLVEYLLMDK